MVASRLPTISADGSARGRVRVRGAAPADGPGSLRPDGLVWTHADGRPVHPKTFYKRFRKLTTEAGLPPMRLHDVRHSYASAALASADGWHEVKVISQRLGHATVAITLDTYSHVLPAADVSVAHTLARLILRGD
jgi:integrase